MHLTSIIIEDEKRAISSLSNLLNTYCPKVTIQHAFTNIKDAVNFLMKNEIHVVFLDIHLPEENGFELFSYFPQPKFNTIFTTAYNEYSIQALRLSATDYLLKPINKDELILAVKRAEENIQSKKVMTEIHSLREMVQSKFQKLPLPTSSGFMYVEIDDILYCEANRNYTSFYFRNENKHMVSKNLKTYEAFLTNFGFMRVSRSYIVNLKFVKSFSRSRGGEITMSDHKVISISSEIKNDLIQRLSGSR